MGIHHEYYYAIEKKKDSRIIISRKINMAILRYYAVLCRIWDPLDMGIDPVGYICIASTCLSSKTLNLSIWSFNINLKWYARKNSGFSSSSFCHTGKTSRYQIHLFCEIHMENIDNTRCLLILRNERLTKWIKQKNSDISFLSHFSLKISSSSY